MTNFFLYLRYLYNFSYEKAKYQAAKKHGCYCEWIREGTTKYNPSRPPQHEPVKLSFSDFRHKMNTDKMLGHHLGRQAFYLATQYKVDPLELFKRASFIAFITGPRGVNEGDLNWALKKLLVPKEDRFSSKALHFTLLLVKVFFTMFAAIITAWIVMIVVPMYVMDRWHFATQEYNLIEYFSIVLLQLSMLITAALALD